MYKNNVVSRVSVIALMLFGFISMATMAYAAGTGGLSVSITPAVMGIDAGQQYIFNANVSGGTLYSNSNYAYQWYNLTSGAAVPIQYANNLTLSGFGGSTGTFTYQLQAIDSVGNVANGTVQLTVNQTPSVYLNTSNATLDSGQNYQLSATYTPGSGSATFLWNTAALQVASGCGFSTSSTCIINTASALPGSYTISVAAKDSAPTPYETAPASASLQLNSAPLITITPSATSLGTGQMENYTVTITGGTGPFNIVLYDASGDAISSTSISLPGTSSFMSFSVPTTAQTVTYMAVATDLGTSYQYNFVSAKSNVTVNAPSAPAPSSATPVSKGGNSMLLLELVPLALSAAVIYYVLASRKPEVAPRRERRSRR